jgi:hypothetical protein
MPVTSNEAEGYAYCELPIDDMTPGIYMFYSELVDCAGNYTGRGYPNYFEVQ